MEKNRFYVYAYCDPLFRYEKIHLGYYFEFTPFYIGKGTNGRFKVHLNEAKRTNRTTNHKINKIKTILNLNEMPIILKLKENLSEQDAFHLEINLIKNIGRRDLKTGPLCNLYDMQGVNLNKDLEELRKSKTRGALNGMYGKTHTREVKEKLSEMKKKLVGELHPHYGKPSPLQGKTYEEMYGIEKALKLKQAKSLKMKANNYQVGKKKPKECRDKISFSRIGAKNPMAVPLMVINLETGIEKRYNTIAEVILDFPFLTRYKISKILNKKNFNSKIIIDKIK